MDAPAQQRSTARQGGVLKSFAFKAKIENALDQGGTVETEMVRFDILLEVSSMHLEISLGGELEVAGKREESG